ncbi:MAG TPA: hypothetical protein VG326_08450 [Tepidisphaeraceae bacterium]|nr:hypothetical protein [Tepidisphaeraceae bacterium]
MARFRRRNWVLCGVAMWAGMTAIVRAEESPLTLNPAAPSEATAPLMLDNTAPAEALRPRSPESSIPDQGAGGMVHPWLLQPVNVVGHKPSDVREDQEVGSYNQPIWTVDRRFSETRVYVRPEGSLEFEFWLIPQAPRKGPTEIDTQYELEFGLPHRIQLDLYLTNRVLKSGGSTFTDYAVELRYAFADWNVIWGNPTYYIEYTHQDEGPDQLETKMLFGGAFAPRWHWGWDLTYQRNMGGDNENTYETTAGVSYAVIDNKFDAGAEFKLQENDFHNHRSHLRDNTLLGPSFQWRPIERMHIDLTPLIGITHESDAVEAYLVVGWEF